MIFDLSRRHWWNPTLAELRVEGENWAQEEIEKCQDSFVFKVIQPHEFCEFLKDAMPDYSVCDVEQSPPSPPGFIPAELEGDPWAPMRHWDDLPY